MKKKLKISVEGKTYEVEVEEIGVEATPTTPTSTPQQAAPKTSKGDIKPATSGGESIPAPIPGKVLSIKVKLGETVKAGQIILILEAMKMENEISATIDGKINDILVNEGQSVNAGDLLAIIG